MMKHSLPHQPGFYEFQEKRLLMPQRNFTGLERERDVAEDGWSSRFNLVSRGQLQQSKVFILFRE